MVALTTPSFFKKNLDFRTLLPYSLTMTIAELKEIIDMNADAAESGCHQAQGLLVNAEAELDDLLIEATRPQRSPSDEQFEADMLDLGGCSDPYAQPSPFGRTGSGW